MSLALLDAGDRSPHQAIGLRGKIVIGQAANALPVTPSADPIYVDPETSEPVPVSIYVGATGNVTVIPYGLKGDATVTFTAVPAGSMLPVAVTAVTAGPADLVAIW